MGFKEGDMLKVSAADFDAYIRQYPDQRVELIGGEIVEMVSNDHSSALAIEIAFRIKLYLSQSDLTHKVTGADSGFQVGADRYSPDVAVTPHLLGVAYQPDAPLLVVEVVSPGNTAKELNIKTSNYLAAGCIVWMVYPDDREIVVHRPGKAAQVLTIADTLMDDTVLPGFAVSVKVIFEVLE
jgi:Uma2 family endonuclease